MGRGRPKGVKNGEGKGLAPIVKWTPLHENVVHLHCCTWPNEKIADKLEITPQRVSQILSDPKAQAIIKAVIMRQRDMMMGEVGDGLLALAHKGIKRIAETIDEDTEVGTRAKVHQDRMSLELVKLVSTNKEEEKKERSLSESLAKRLVAALEKTNEVDEYHGRVVEGEVEIEEEEELIHAGQT